MTITDILIVAVLLVIVGIAAGYIIKEKRNGAKCIGCPSSKNCAHKCAGCNGQCSDKKTEENK